MPSSESSNTSASHEEAQLNNVAPNEQPTAESQQENLSVLSDETGDDANLVNRQQPIPPPSEPMQYRAIGLVRGRYLASNDQFTQGTLLTTDGTLLDAVLLGRIMSLVKNHLDLEQEHLWVVYPRTRQENDKLHIQIVGVWEPENLAKQSPEENEENPPSVDQTDNNDSVETLVPSTEVPDGGFSVRGEVVYQSFENENLVIKIKQAARKQTDKAKYFKLKLKGQLQTKAVGKFWDFQIKREADALVIQHGEVIAELPKKRRPPMKRGPGGGGGRRPGGKKPFPKRTGETPRPIRKTGDAAAPASPVPRPVPKGPTPKPIKRTKPPQE
jgi:hypothetical protein